MSLLIGFVLALAVSADSREADPQITLTLRGGSVWLTVKQATLPQVMDTWARQGRMTIVGFEHLRGQPFDLDLANVTEEDALAILLRPAVGYMAVIRQDAGPGDSKFQRIWILPGKPSTPTAAATPAPPPDPAAVQPAIGPDGLPVPDDQQRDPAQRVPFRSTPPGFSPPPERPAQPRGRGQGRESTPVSLLRAES